jgi:hypothetical protein
VNPFLYKVPQPFSISHTLGEAASKKNKELARRCITLHHHMTLITGRLTTDHRTTGHRMSLHRLQGRIITNHLLLIMALLLQVHTDLHQAVRAVPALMTPTNHILPIITPNSLIAMC